MSNLRFDGYHGKKRVLTNLDWMQMKKWSKILLLDWEPVEVQGNGI